MHPAQPTTATAAPREIYLEQAWLHIPRLLGSIDRNPFRATYGCFDRQFWHYRTADFPSEMYQEGVLPLAFAYTQHLPGNRWYGEPRLRELAIAGLRYAARSCHADGSCDDYYPFERALGAAVFSLQAAARAYELLDLHDDELLAWLKLRADWVSEHRESGRLSNHQALAALGLARVGRITGENRYARAADDRLHELVTWQSDEGWFEEYGGADPGYQTVTIDCLAKCRELLSADWLSEPIERGVRFCRLFLHRDGSYGGEYGSRGTYHFYPAGFELLAEEHPAARELACAFRGALAAGKHAYFDDDRLFAHRLGNLLEAYAAADGNGEIPNHATSDSFLPQAGLLVRSDDETQTIVSAARGGVWKRFSAANNDRPQTDAGIIVEFADGRMAASQTHDRGREIETVVNADGRIDGISITGPLYFFRGETMTPRKLLIFRAGLVTVGRFCRTLVRRLLQRRLITGRKTAPLLLTRRLEWLPTADGGERLRVTDALELQDRRVQVRRLAVGTDHQTAYVAACGVYQESVLEPWTFIEQRDINKFNATGRVTLAREFG